MDPADDDIGVKGESGLRKTWRFLAAALLIFFGAGGLQGLWNNLGNAETLFQQSVFVGLLLLGFAGLAAGLGGLMRKAWAGPAALLFALGMAYAAGVGPVAWGEVGWSRGALHMGIGFLIGIVLYSGVRSCSASPETP
jgi:hypothetical protein